MGLLVAMDKHIKSEIPVSIVSLDINPNSLELQKYVINRLKNISERKIELTQFTERIIGRVTFDKYASNAFPDKAIDFLLFSKVGCELHAKGLFSDSEVYYDLLTSFKTTTSEVGVVAMMTNNIFCYEGILTYIFERRNYTWIIWPY